MDEAAVVPLGTVGLEEVLARAEVLARMILGIVVHWDTSPTSALVEAIVVHVPRRRRPTHVLQRWRRAVRVVPGT